MRAINELKRVRALYSHLNQQGFGTVLNLSPPKISEMINGKRPLTLRVIRRLVELGGNANELIRND